MSKVLLIAVNAKYIHSNPAVYSLGAYAREALEQLPGVEIEIAEYTINQNTETILADIYRRKPQVAHFPVISGTGIRYRSCFWSCRSFCRIQGSGWANRRYPSTRRKF